MRRHGASSWVLVLAAVFSASSSAAQNTPPQSTPSVQIDVDLVLTNVTVTDNRNRFVKGLRAEHFRVWEDRVEQEIRYFANEEGPVTLGIILDRSGSMGGAAGGAETKLSAAVTSAYSCLEDTLREDEFFLIEFSNQPQVTADFTTDIDTLKQKLIFKDAGGRTALWDAVYAGAEKLRGAGHPRRALLVLTDGLENRSRYSLSDLRDFLREQEIRIYSTSQWLQDLSELTGGRILRSLNPCVQLAEDLKNQYVVGYRSTNGARDGRWRDLRIRVAPETVPGLSRLSVSARTGYYAGVQ